MSTKVGIVGSGRVGQTLANGFLKDGYDVTIGTNTASKREELRSKTNERAKIGSFEDAAKFGEIVVLATKGTAAEAHFVKSFSCIGHAFMVNPDFNGVKPTMFICGNHDGAKSEVKTILDQLGFDVSDMGAVEGARAIEPLCILWCIPGFLSNSWTHAFKLLKAGQS